MTRIYFVCSLRSRLPKALTLQIQQAYGLSIQQKRAVEKTTFGKTPDGETVELFTLANANNLTAKITNFGALLTELHVPDRNNVLADVVLGFDNLESYLKGHPHFGCTTGRVANRIAKGRFTLHGESYSLAINNGPNHLHGGLKGIDKRIWKASPIEHPGAEAVQFSYRSPDGEEGYPGNLDIQVTYILTNTNELQIEYRATTDKPTPLNLTNHSYFNLEGAGAGLILDHELMINAQFYTPADETSIPTGEILDVADSPMDFTRSKRIGTDFDKMKGEPGGYDLNFVLNKDFPGQLALAAKVRGPKSGRILEVFTTEPGIQLYTANYLDGQHVGKGETAYEKQAAFCLECQCFPDSVNRPHFPTVILNPGMEYFQTTVHRFSAE